MTKIIMGASILLLVIVVICKKDMESPKTKLMVRSGRVEVFTPQKTLKTIKIPIEEYNRMNNGEWELIDTYVKKDIETSLWKNRETGKELEILGNGPPSFIKITSCGERWG